MCKDCQYAHLKDAYEVQEAMLLHKAPDGYSGYPGARWLFNRYLDDKESLEVLIGVAERMLEKEGLDEYEVGRLKGCVECGKAYRDDLCRRMRRFIEPQERGNTFVGPAE